MMRERAGVEVSCGSFATEAALNIYKARRIAFFSPYFPAANAQVRRFYEDCGFTVVRDLCLQRPSPVQIAHTTDDMAATRCARSMAMTGRDCAGGYQFVDGAVCSSGRTFFGQASDRHQHRHLLARPVRGRHPRPAAGLWQAAVAPLKGI